MAPATISDHGNHPTLDNPACQLSVPSASPGGPRKDRRPSEPCTMSPRMECLMAVDGSRLLSHLRTHSDWCSGKLRSYERVWTSWRPGWTAIGRGHLVCLYACG